MAELKWTEQALCDVETIASYIARDSTFYAQTFAQKIFEYSVCKVKVKIIAINWNFKLKRNKR